MNEKEYLGRLSKLSEDGRKTILHAQEKYGDNHWWLSEDPLVIARYQLFENIGMSDLDVQIAGLQKLLGRPVYHQELAFDVEELREEAKVAIWKLEGGESLETPFDYQLKKVHEAMQLLENNGVKTIVRVTDD